MGQGAGTSGVRAVQDYFALLRSEHSRQNAKKYYDGIRRDFNHYFRNVSQILKLIDGETEKIKYAAILKAQLSDAEISLLFYHCFWNEDDSFKKLAISMKLFDNLPDAGLLDVAHREQFFKSDELRTPDK